MVLSAAMLTVDSIFLAAFVAFMLLAVTTFVSMEMKRSVAAADATAHFAAATSRRLPLSLSRASLTLMAAILAFATVLFFVLPRVSAGYLRQFAPRSELVSGFSDDVNLGEIGEIKKSNTIVMHVQIENDRGNSFHLKWRGLALKTFDGKRWFNPPQHYELHRMVASGLDLTPWFQLPFTGRRSVPPRPLRYRVLMEPIGTNVFFFAATPRRLYGKYRDVSVDATGTVRNEDRRMIDAYDAYSDLAQPPDEDIRAAALVRAFDRGYLQLPQLDPRVPALAEELSAQHQSPYDKAVAIERHLFSNFGYTLQLPQTPAGDPLAQFLFERKEGHCEYFASAMAVMLRTLGIPSRIVNGFRTSELNDVTGSYIIRARDAHSWVEAYFPDYGWISFDPTPPDPKIVPNEWTRVLLYLDAAREFWREWVVNYDFSHQVSLTQNIRFRGRDAFQNARQWLRDQYRGLVARMRQTYHRAQESPREWGGGAVLVLAGIVVLLNLRRLWRAWRTRRLARNPERAPQAAASIWYDRMTRRLSRRGWRKAPAQTPQEFVAAIQEPSLQRSVAAFTAHYERARFGESAEDAKKLPELYDEISVR
jgi:transglutaminase-like putative cysteine protease